MNAQNRKTELLGRAPVPRALLAMGLPTMTGMMINALYNLADAGFVSRLGTQAMGAISVTYPLGQVVVGLGLLFGSGAASCISRLLGRGDRDAANRVANTALFGSLIAGAAIIALTLLFLEPILRLLGATEGILPYAKRYAGIYVASSIFNVINVTMNSIATSEGAAKTTMAALLTGALLNILLDPVMIYGLNLGVSGAAIATALSQAVSSGVYLRYMRSGSSAFRFHPRECRFSKAILSGIFQIGVPTLIFQLLTGLSVTLTNLKAAPYGDSVIAGMGAVTRIVSLGTLMVFGFIKGFQPVAGYSYGAGNLSRLREAIRTAVIWTTLFCALLGLALICFPAPIMSLFAAGDAALIRVGQRALQLNGLSVTLFGFYTVYSSLFLALGRAKAGLFLGVCRQGICFLPAILLLPAAWGLNGILCAQPAADLAAALIAAVMAARLRRSLFA
ncbi:MAG: MATE family efflux transporter [Clostridia bacterium]|nr:MATE family efflux transporter [Clostridia bacterium]